MNHLMVLHVQKERLDSTNLIDVVNVLVGRVDNRKQIFGLFTKRDLSVKTEVAHKSTKSQGSIIGRVHFKLLPCFQYSQFHSYTHFL